MVCYHISIRGLQTEFKSKISCLVSSQQTKGCLSMIISALVTEDWSQVIGACEVDSWKEALAAALTYAKNEEFPALCGKMRVSRLLK